MKMSKTDEAKLDAFIDNALAYIKTKDKPKYYKPNSRHQPGSGAIELMSGILVPEASESVLVLDKEYSTYLFNLVHKFAELMRDSFDNPLFGFAERSLWELITLWLFIDVHKAVGQKDKDRVKVLLFAGHYKHVEKNTSELNAYLKQKAGLLTKKDIRCLTSGTETGKDYFTRLWSIANELKANAGTNNSESLLRKYSNYDTIIGHQAMRVHANPLSVNETLNNQHPKLRRKLLLALYVAQVCEYLSPSDTDAAKIVAQHDELQSNISIEA